MKSFAVIFPVVLLMTMVFPHTSTAMASSVRARRTNQAKSAPQMPVLRDSWGTHPMTWRVQSHKCHLFLRIIRMGPGLTMRRLSCERDFVTLADGDTAYAASRRRARVTRRHHSLR